MGMVEPGAMRGQQEPTIRSKHSTAFPQIPIEIPDMFKNLEGNNAVRLLIGQIDSSARLNSHIHIAVQITGHVIDLSAAEERFVGTIPASQVEDALAWK
jgi:hypothetical protein